MRISTRVAVLWAAADVAQSPREMWGKNQFTIIKIGTNFETFQLGRLSDLKSRAMFMYDL